MPKRRLSHAQRKRHQEAADWIIRNREADQVSEEREAFQRWLHKDPENLRAYETAKLLLGDAPQAIKSDPALRNFEAKPARSKKVSGGTLLGLAIIGTLFFYFDGPIRLQADVYSGIGELRAVELEDGSKIHLNASSAVAFDYSDSHRTIYLLKGQALFTVSKDPARPFVVEAGETHVTALGTEFDVRRGKQETDVAVTHNAVLVEFEKTDLQPVRLNKGDRISYGNNGQLSEVTEVDPNSVLAWQRGQLVLDNAPLSYVVEELERRFYGEIVIASDSLAKKRVSGTISITDTRSALAFIETALGLKSKSFGPLIVLHN